ncbi:DUF1702 family protein [Amycolatopsis nigrescens]|uniref:DUF1702 family protein n=1 Tax=Amycolatopsis nigrescens TaxID=381445 RepID=UPI0003998A66|nr:DUF1702 family protein [Amycolatopsis nigrescens]
MPTLMGVLRRRVFAPSLESVGFAGRGFPVTPTAATARLEMVPQAVVCGFEWGIEAPPLWEIERRLAMVEPEQRGFGYEGATMAFTILDAMPLGRRDRTRELLLGPGHEHIFLAYIGIGFAMARLPRPLWKQVLPDLSESPYHPTMSWLAVDGYGFDRAYFDTRRWVDEQYQPAPYPWQGAPDYFRRAVDQGIGRALWFIHGAGAAGAAEAVNRFPEHRRADLWSGIGLAATFAGGCDRAGLSALRKSAGEHHAELALGSVFAIKARTYSSFVPRHSRLAVTVLTDLTVDAATELADRTVVGPAEGDAVPAYELWRQRIRAHFGTAQQRLAG